MNFQPSSAKTVIDLFKLVQPPIMNGHTSFDSAQEILSRLKFIGALDPGDKINVRSQSVEQNYFWTPLERKLFGESRSSTFSYLYNTIERAFNILYSLASTDKVSDCMVCAHILQDMAKAISGITNLQNTYREDKHFRCNLETLIQMIQAKTYEVQQRFPEIYKLSVETANLFNPYQNSSPSTSPSLPPSSSLTSIPPLAIVPSSSTATTGSSEEIVAAPVVTTPPVGKKNKQTN